MFAVAVAYHAFYYLYGMPTGGDVGIHARESVHLFETVRRDLPQDAVLAFARPRVIALFGERKATIWPAEGGAEKAWDYFDEVGVTHLVIARPESGLKYPEFLRFYDRPPPPFLEPLHANNHFTIYRYR